MKLSKQERQPRGRTIRNIIATLGYFGAWGLIAVLLVPALMQVKTLLVFIALLIINNETLRPPGWNTDTLVGVDKCTTFLAIGTWLFVVMFAERYLREAREQGRFWVQAGRAIVVIIGIYGASAALLFLLG